MSTGERPRDNGQPLGDLHLTPGKISGKTHDDNPSIIPQRPFTWSMCHMCISIASNASRPTYANVFKMPGHVPVVVCMGVTPLKGR